MNWYGKILVVVVVFKWCNAFILSNHVVLGKEEPCRQTLMFNLCIS